MVDIRRAVVRIRTLRIISLIVFFVLFNAILFGFQPLPLVLPVLQSMGDPAKTVGDAFATMQYMLWQPVFPWLSIASFLIVAVLLGRMTCGWVCPFGFVQEILGYVKRKHLEISPRTHNEMIYVKYVILGATLFVSLTVAVTAALGVGQNYKNAFGVFAQAPFDVLSPHDTLFAALPNIVYKAVSAQSPYTDIGVIGSFSPLFWVRLFILALVLVFAFYTPRSWCRYLCPVGATLALMNRFSFLGLKREAVHCTKESCRSCVEVCPMKVPILDLPWEKFTHPECIYCLECVDACTTKAIRPKVP